MPVFHLNKLPKEKRIQMIGEFYDTIDSLKNRNEVRLFFKSLLTADEITNFMRRIEIAVLLSANFKYEQIIEFLGVGRGKISNVHKALLQDDSGYKIIIKRLIENRKKWLIKIKTNERKKLLPLILPKNNPRFLILNYIVDTVIKKMESGKEKELDKEALIFTPSASIKHTKD